MDVQAHIILHLNNINDYVLKGLLYKLYSPKKMTSSKSFTADKNNYPAKCIVILYNDSFRIVFISTCGGSNLTGPYPLLVLTLGGYSNFYLT